MITGYVLGWMSALPCMFGLTWWLDRRDERRRRTTLRIDQTPVPLPGAYEPWSERSLPGVRTHTVVDGEGRS
ncbi:hypothetical protein EV383_4328 [Pseudonocardia sediminis]|uniref:Uncharacterized protein n=1 Tax=Pseudonocardia sediminis TaxID=1397368 RepID=A0A4Q7V004_PSEST|nr:hypothetical protein EV383_4328 [Pseudonocardia sediminis]